MIIDVSVHPTLGDEELRRQLGAPWNKARLPHLLGTRYEPPFAELVAPLDRTGDPQTVSDALFVEQGIDAAIVTPMTRGLLPNPQQAAAVAHATNSWVAERWLPFHGEAGRFLGSIRLAVTDVAAAVTEIETWADHERFVQLAVPLRTFLPYGDEFYFPIWRAAAERGFPVCVYDDASNVVENYETPVGAMRYFTEKHAVRPLAGIVHLSSLITSGVFDRLPDLQFVMGDGGVDLSRPMFWRIDRDWRQGRVEVPWVEKLPSLYLADHVRFVSQPEDGRSDGRSVDEDLVRISDSEQLLLFGSHYPYWDYTDARAALQGWPEETRDKVLARNALEALPRIAANMTRIDAMPASR